MISLASVAIVAVALQACKTYYFRSNYREVNALLHNTGSLQEKPFLKAHMKDGSVFILKDTWHLDTTRNIIIGSGSRYDMNRQFLNEGFIWISIDSVAIFETNTKLGKTETARIAALSILAGLDVIGGILCLTNPKACFGSCPTFYINDDDNFHYADAEAFSNAIRPSLEYADIDALGYKAHGGSPFTLTMKNEALETHCVKDVRLLAIPGKDSAQVYQTRSGEFYKCSGRFPVNRATAEEGEIACLLKEADRQEWFSLADEQNMCSKQEIYLVFDNLPGMVQPGFVINFRQTLMTTYLIYSSLGYMGDQVADVYAMLETDEKTRGRSVASVLKELGDIDVYLWNSNLETWEFQGGFYETGPIAINRQILPLKTAAIGSEMKLKIILNKGYWRIDYLGLTDIEEKVLPLEITPYEILYRGVPDPDALAQIRSGDRHLISMPGDVYQFRFALPDGHDDYELFLRSKGYYLEWMRESWLRDKDLLKLRQMIRNPGKYLREEARSYKEYEKTMEEAFWNSRIDTEIFSYHEN